MVHNVFHPKVMICDWVVTDTVTQQDSFPNARH